LGVEYYAIIFDKQQDDSVYLLKRIDLMPIDLVIRMAMAVFLLLLVSQAHAIRVTNLYEATVPVKNQTPSARAAALQDVLRQIVIKVTGQSVLPASMSRQSSQIQHMVEQFGYESRQKTATARPKLYLRAKLNSTRVKQLIREAGLPIWPEERPATLVWLAIDDDSGRQIMAEDSSHKAIALLQKTADKRGLPIVLPLMDLQESSVVGFEVIAAMQPEALQPPSEKYASQHVLIGHIQQVDGGLWRGRWKSIDNEQLTTTPAGPLSDAIAAGINPLATRIARQFSSHIYVDSEQYMDLVVDDVRGATDYAHSLTYLQSLSLVSQVDVVGVDQQGVNFRLHTRADLAAILQVIELGHVLYARDTIDQLVFGLNP